VRIKKENLIQKQRTKVNVANEDDRPAFFKGKIDCKYSTRISEGAS